MSTLHDRLAAVAEAHADHLAVAIDGAELTFGELGHRSDRLAGYLREQGVLRGDRITLIADHHVDAVVAFWAILKAGAAIVQLNPKMGAEALGTVLAECRPKVILASESYCDPVTKILPKDAVLCRLEDPDLWSPHQGNGTGDDITEDDLAALIYTSGSTGQPKGVCLTHRNLWTVIGAVIDDLEVTPRDSYLMAVPLHYVHGIMQLLIHHLAGAAVHLARDFAFPQQIVNALKTTGATGFSGVPFHFNNLIENSNFLEADLPALRWLTVTGGRLDAARIRTIRQAMPHVDFLVAYGQTECAPRATALSPKRIDRKPDSVGSAIRGVRVLILDDQGKEQVQGEIGDVVVEGPNVMAGYWQQPEATAAVIDSHGRLHTGDVGYLDDEGDLFLVGRKSQMIKSAGERIFPKEIENVLTEAEEVLEAVVLGVPDAILGERVEAHVRLSPDTAGQPEKTLTERLRRLCLKRMPLARAPRRLHLWLEFPSRDNGKVDALRLARFEGGKPFCQGSQRLPADHSV